MQKQVKCKPGLPLSSGIWSTHSLLEINLMPKLKTKQYPCHMFFNMPLSVKLKETPSFEQTLQQKHLQRATWIAGLCSLLNGPCNFWFSFKESQHIFYKEGWQGKVSRILYTQQRQKIHQFSLNVLVKYYAVITFLFSCLPVFYR